MIRLRSARLNTWNPPESVRIGPSQPMNVCNPPTDCDHLLAGPQGEVIGVRQQHPGPGGAKLIGREPLDRRLGSHGHERRRLDRAVRVSSRPSRAREPGSTT